MYMYVCVRVSVRVSVWMGVIFLSGPHETMYMQLFYKLEGTTHTQI